MRCFGWYFAEVSHNHYRICMHAQYRTVVSHTSHGMSSRRCYDTAKYRPIAVGEPLSRLYASILVQRLVQYTEQRGLRSPTQAGYRPGHSTIHQAFVLQHVVDTHIRHKSPLYLCFVDLKSAYDRVQWQLLWDLLCRLGV